MKYLFFLFGLTIILSCSSNSSGSNPNSMINNCNSNSVYLDENGITIKACPDADYGDTGTIGDIEYTIVDRETLLDMTSEGDDYSKICTSKITDMSGVFRSRCGYSDNRSLINQDISSWDVSNVTDMSAMFYGNKLNLFNYYRY